MFYDRTKIEPPNRVEINVFRRNLAYSRAEYGKTHYIEIEAAAILDNSGRRPASITNTKLKLSYKTDKDIAEYFDGRRWYISNAIDPIGEQNGNFPTPILLGPNKTLTCTLSFRKRVPDNREEIARSLLDQYRKLESYSYEILVTTISGSEFNSDPIHMGE